jgi:uridine kinase
VSDVDENSVDFSKKELGKVAKNLISHFSARRAVAIVGCSSSWKLTFSRPIAHARRKKRFDCVVLAMDNHYKMPGDISVGHNELKGIECSEALENDLRLIKRIKRIIRDDKTRGYPICASARRCTSVRVGEDCFITSNIESADMFFNSALVYELIVLSAVGVPLLHVALAPLDDELA